MNEEYDRNSIYFFYMKSFSNYLYLLLEYQDLLYVYPSLCPVGKKEEFYDNDDLVIAPIDLLLFHIPKLEYLNRNYNELERTQLKLGLKDANEYRKLKYHFNLAEINLLYQELSNIQIEELDRIIKKYHSYFLNRKKDSVLRILDKSIL